MVCGDFYQAQANADAWQAQHIGVAVIALKQAFGVGCVVWRNGVADAKAQGGSGGRASLMAFLPAGGV